jgi:hypothetical protein
MSGRISIGFVDFAEFLLDFDPVRSASLTSFLVRNWCGFELTERMPRLRPTRR